jgi:alkylation response protein AidB-like acyl-CoA dehydrogenase
VARAGRRVAKAAIQLHGGMGVTDEMPASHYAKRLTMIGTWLDALR